MNIVTMVRDNHILNTVYGKLTDAIEIVTFYVFQEYLKDIGDLNIKPKIEDLKVEIFQSREIKIIAASKEVDQSEENFLNRVNNGCTCLGVKHRGRIAAYTWCNLKYFEYEKRMKYRLNDDEAYLFDARTFKAYRGNNIAPYLRYQLYLHLKNIGRTKYLSTSSTMNTAAVKFKEKLKARKKALYLYIRLFHKYHHSIRLKKYI